MLLTLYETPLCEGFYNDQALEFAVAVQVFLLAHNQTFVWLGRETLLVDEGKKQKKIKQKQLKPQMTCAIPLCMCVCVCVCVCAVNNNEINFAVRCTLFINDYHSD